MFDGWESALLHTLPYAANLREHFAPERPKHEDLALKIILDIVGLGFLTVSHGAWHNVRIPCVVLNAFRADGHF